MILTNVMKVFRPSRTRNLGLLLLALLSSPAISYAHVKWFSRFSFADRPMTLAEVINPLFLGLLVLSMVVIGLLVVIDRWLTQHDTFQRFEMWMSDHKEQSTLVMRVAMGATFLLCWQADAMLVPELKISSPFIGWLQFVLALLLIFPQTTPLAGLGLGGLYFYGATQFGIFYMLDYLHYIGIALFLILSNEQRLQVRAIRLPILYATVGFSLSWLALEKIVYPDWALYLLEQNPQLTMGLPVIFFLTSAAFVEFSLGYLLIICLFQRPLALVITLVFFTTTAVFGKVEVIGHTTLHAALIIFLLNGPGTVYRAPITFHNRTPLRVAFASVNFALLLGVMLFAYSNGAWFQYRAYLASLPKLNVAATSAPTVQLSATGTTLHIQTTRFTGEAYVYVNNEYVGSTHSGIYELGALPPGVYRVAVTLHDEEQRFVMVGGELIAAKQLVVVN
jgi:hypothetical protein